MTWGINKDVILWAFHLCIIFLGFTSPRWAHAQNVTARIQGFEIEAKKFFRDTDLEIADLEGGVKLNYKDQEIRCDSAHVNLRAKKVEARGNVRISSPNAMIGGEVVILDYENSTGIIYNGYVQSGTVIFEGQILQKVSETEYYVLDANYTTCTNCPASWQFSGRSIRAELGGYAYIKNSVIRSGPIPILWLPYLIVPLKSDRQTGLLTPELERTDSGGLAVAQSAFWAISRSTDLTFTLKNYELRGLKALAEYRYVLDENSEGQLNYATLDDLAIRDDKRFNTYRLNDAAKDKSLHRWFIKYNHYQELPDNYIHRMQINNASDLQYPKDFYNETLNHGDPAMENRVSITKNTNNHHFSLDSSYYINLLHADPLSGNDDAVHRLPELRYALTPQAFGKTDYYYTFDFNYTNFTRSSQAYDDLVAPSGTSAFGRLRYPQTSNNSPTWENVPGQSRILDHIYHPDRDLIRTGQRIDFHPNIYKSFQIIDGVEVIPKVGYRETHYIFSDLPVEAGKNVESTNVRRYLRTEIASRIQTSRVYGNPNEIRGTLWKHEIQPEIRYTRLPWVDHQAHPFFGFNYESQREAPYFASNILTDEDLLTDSGIQFDYNDRLYDLNLVTYSITNRLVQKRWRNNEPEYRQVGLLRLSQSYDAFQDEKNDPNKQPWSDISALLEVRLDNLEAYSTTRYYPYQKVYNTDSKVRLKDDWGRFVQLGLNHQYKIVPGQDADSSTRKKDYNFAVGLLSSRVDFMGKISFDASKFEGNTFFERASNYSNNIHAYSYVTQVKPPGDCIAIRFTFEQETGGESSMRLNLAFSFDGKGVPSLSDQDLSQIGQGI